MFCNQSCLEEGRKRFHQAERAFINDTYERLDQPLRINPRIWEILNKRILQALSIDGSVKRLRKIFESSERKTIFDFDLRGRDENSKDLIYLTITSSMKETSMILAKEKLAIHAAEYLKAIGQTPFVKSNSDRKDLKKYLAFLLNITSTNAFGVTSY